MSDASNLYASLNNAYYSSAYNQSLGQQGKAKGFWDWVQDPNRENYNANDYSAAQSFISNQESSFGSPTVATPPSSMITNTSTPNMSNPISGTTSVGPSSPVAPSSPISGTVTPQSLTSSPMPINTAPVTPITASSSSLMDMPSIVDANKQKRLASFGAIQ